MGVRGWIILLLCVAWTICAPPIHAQTSAPATVPATEPKPLAMGEIQKTMEAGAQALLNFKPLENTSKAMVLFALLEAAPNLDMPALLPTSPAMADRIAAVVGIEPKSLAEAAWQLKALGLLPERSDTHSAQERASKVLLEAMKEDKEARPARLGAAGLSEQELYLGVDVLTSISETPEELWKQLEKVCQPAEAGAVKRFGPFPAVGEMDLNQAAAAAITQLRVFDALHADLRKPGEEDKAIAPTMARVVSLFKAQGVSFISTEAYALSDLVLYTGQRRLAGTLWIDALDHTLLADPFLFGLPHGAGKYSEDANAQTAAKSLIVLARINAPVALCKFSYDGDWNGRPRDVANITAWLGDALDRPLRWQIVSTSDDATAWNMAPLLFMTGSKDPLFAPDTLARLRDFAGQGGLILSSPDNRSEEFTRAIEEHWAPAAFDNDFKLRELPEDHPLFTLWGKLTTAPKLESIGNGVRELWVHSHSDLAATWHARRTATRDQWTLAANFLLYTTGRDNFRLPVAPRKDADVAADLKVEMAAVMYEGNWNPEPQMDRAITAQARRFGVDLHVVDAWPADLDAAAMPIAHLTGAGAMKLTEPEIASLKKYTEAGGLLVVDAAGGDEAFTKSFEAIVEKITPGMKLQPVPLNHPIYNGAVPGSVKISAANYRKSTTAQQGHLAAPRLQACMDEAGRPRIIFSADDLTCGVLGITTWGILGYDENSARALMRNMIAYVAHGGKTTESIPAGTHAPGFMGPQGQH